MPISTAATGMKLSIEGLSVDFPLDGRQFYPAVRDVSFGVARGEVLAIVGESGCGKSATALALMKLHPPATRMSGEVRLGDRDLLTLPDRDMRRVRGRCISMVFQDPMTSLDPRHRIGDQIAEAVLAHEKLSSAALYDRVIELLELVRVPDPDIRYRQFPHQLSGGLRQRVSIAVGLAPRPDFLLADEPTTALDVSIQAQIIDLLMGLNRELGMGLVLISHDLPMVSKIADRLIVMYAGQIVESGPSEQILTKPAHPYTHALLKALPQSGMVPKQRLYAIKGNVPDLRRLPSGCAFHDRCAAAAAICKTEPELIEDASGRALRCWQPN